MGDSTHRGARFWRKSPKLYPHACASLGEVIGYFHDRHWWHPTGPAQEEFQKVEREILAELGLIFIDTYSSIVYFRLYMIGRSAETALPTIMFFCEEKEPRRRAKKAMDDGNILNTLPGFRTGHQARQPGLGMLIQPATRESQTKSRNESGSASHVYFDPSRPIKTSGMAIFVKHPSGLLRQATANVVFEAQTFMYMSVAYIISDHIVHGNDTVQDCDSDYDLGSESDGEHDEIDNRVDITSRGSISSPDEMSVDMPDSASSSSDSPKQTIESSTVSTTLLDRLEPSVGQEMPAHWPMSEDIDILLSGTENLGVLGTIARLSMNMDWVLIEIHNETVSAFIQQEKSNVSNYRISTDQHDVQDTPRIVAHTSHGLIGGDLLDNATYIRLASSSTFEKVYQIALDSPLRDGDCGSFVVSAMTAKPHGHIVASSSAKDIAYIVPAPPVFEASGTQWIIPSICTDAPNDQG
jgi:hypothetical protein